MGKSEIFLLILAATILFIRLYQKYKKKEQNKKGDNTKTSLGNVSSSLSKDDEYEPYSKK